MKKGIVIVLICSALFLLSGCAMFDKGLYYSIDNWVIRDNAVPRYYAMYDVFYVYPSMVNNPEITYINWTKDNIGDSIYNFTVTQTSDIFDIAHNAYKREHENNTDRGSMVRIFSPFIHQVEHGKYIEAIKGNYTSRKSPLRPGINDTVKALEHYFKYYHKKGRPFILVGHGQGAVDLYEAMKKCRKVNPSNGFVAAYFTGLPRISMQKINKDFNSRNIYAGVNEFDTGVVLVWNARPNVNEDSIFIDKNSFSINPVNWRIDGTIAQKSDDKGASVYNFVTDDLTVRKYKYQNLCDAYVDQGVLVFNEKQVRERFQDAILGECDFQTNLYSLFNMNVVWNAEMRVMQYLYKQLWHREHVSKDE